MVWASPLEDACLNLFQGSNDQLHYLNRRPLPRLKLSNAFRVIKYAGEEGAVLVTKQRKVIVHIAMSADGYIARTNGDVEWLNTRPAPPGFYGIEAFMKSIDTQILGRKTYDASVRLGAKFSSRERTIVFSHHPPPKDASANVEFTDEAIGVFMNRIRKRPGKDIWLMGGGEIIASFLDAQSIDEFVISVIPIFIGEGIPLIARRHRNVPLSLQSTEKFDDGLVQLHYSVQATDD